MLLASLSDGQFHSGERLAAEAGLSRAAVHKAVDRLRRAGAPVASLRGRGYRMPAFVALDREAIRAALPEPVRRALPVIEVVTLVPSTNALLLDWLRSGEGDVDGNAGCAGAACIAEGQTSGRGRRGRPWLAPPGAGLPISLSWHFELAPSMLGTLGMACGVAVADALGDCGYAGVGLKWPNDLYVGGRKLGGILVEVAGELNGRCRLVIGVGLNVDLTGVDLSLIDRPVTDLKSFGNGQPPPDRNRIAAAVLARLVDAAIRHERDGDAAALERWRTLDVVNGRDVTVHLPQEQYAGRAVGIDAQGRLLVERGGDVRAFSAGEVSLGMTG